jgi:hypothetical protein
MHGRRADLVDDLGDPVFRPATGDVQPASERLAQLP